MIFKQRLNRKGKLLLTFFFLFGLISTSDLLYAQITVIGKVTDSQKQPIPGANVNIKGTKTYALTDANGTYSINVTNDKATLVFSFVSYLTEEKTVGTNKIINVSLADKVNDLNEVVVVGYGTEKKSDVTGSVSTLKSEELNRSKSVSFIEAMQGKLAGVQITSASGEPGTAVTINIRGANSINAGNTPLYVIDGVQIDANNGESANYTSITNPLSSINPSDIESMEILKDASATAIFGSRGANGVIIITTKTGKGKGSLEFQTYTGLSNANNKIDVADGQQYANYRYDITPGNSAYSMDTNGDGISDAPKDFTGLPQYNWQNLLLRNAISQNYNLSYSEGSEKTSFSVAGGYFKQEGILLNNSYDRYSLNMKIDHRPTTRFRIGTTLNGSYVENEGVGSNNGQSLTYNGIIGNFLMYKPVNVPEDGLDVGDPDAVGGSQSNPLDFVMLAQKSSPLARIINNNYLEYKIIPELTLRVSGGATYTYSDNGEFYPSTTSWGYVTGGTAIYNNANTLNWYSSNTLTYVKRIKKNHYINALLGFDANSYLYKTFSIRAEGFDLQTNNGVDNLDQAKLYSRLPTTNKELTTRAALFGRINYNFKNKYFATATLRRDGSSKFGANNKYALFPSGALAWTISKERFMKNLPAISNLKLRTSFGITGNDRIPAYQSLATASSVYYSSTNTAQLGIAINSTANPDLKWETTYQYDAGLDIEFLDGRFGITADIYAKQTKDMLLLADIPGQTGFTKQYRNIGRVDNRGLELALNTINIKKQNFSWSTKFNITFNRNEIKSLGGTDFIAISANDQIKDIGRATVGQPIGTAYGYVFDGIYQTSDFTDVATSTLKDGVAKRLGVAVKPGDFKFKDLSGDGIVDLTNDRTNISDSNPKYYGGLTNTFSYKNFDINVLALWSFGNEVLNVGTYRLEGYQSGNISEDFYLGHWSETNPTNEYPRYNSTGRYDNSSYYVEDASFLRLKNITLGYNVPNNFTKKLKVSNIRVYLAGENLYTLTNYTGFDPEVSSKYGLLSGYETLSYPRSRTFTFGLNLKF